LRTFRPETAFFDFAASRNSNRGPLDMPAPPRAPGKKKPAMAADHGEDL